MECPICYDAIDATTGVATLSCAHSFHICCIAGWFAKMETGTCPCCRKEMSALEDLPQPVAGDDDEDEEEDEDEDEEVEFSRANLDALLRQRGGVGLTDAMAEAVCPEFALFMVTELNALIVGNGGRHLNQDEWDALIYDDGEDEDDDENDIAAAVAAVWNELASYDAPRAWLMSDGSWVSNILNPEDSTEVTVLASADSAPIVATQAATKMQAVWRGFKGRMSLCM
jgi:hypothetical protein